MSTVPNVSQIFAGSTPLERIVIPAEAGPIVRLAAQELQKYLLRITGNSLSITEEMPALGGFYLLEDPDFPDYEAGVFDRIHIQIDHNSVTMRGENPVSVLYAVYDFLKEFTGVRFFAPGDENEFVPEMNAIHLQSGIVYRNGSAFAIRDFVNRTNQAKVLSFCVKNRINTILGCGPWKDGSDKCSPENAALIHSFGLKVRGPGHSWKHFVPDAALFDTHPEYFSLFDGKRVVNGRTCCFSNPEARRIFMENLRKYLRRHPYWDIFAFWPEDVPDACYCTCPECRKHTTTDWYLSLVNEAAAVVAEELPNATFEMILYQSTCPLPSVPTPFYQNGEKLLIDVCLSQSRNGYVPMHSGDPINQKIWSLLEGWREYLKQISFRGKFIWMEYYNLCEQPHYGPAGRALLWPLENLRKDINAYRQQSDFAGLGAFTGYDLLAFPTPFKLWAWFNLWSKPERTIQQLEEEFYPRYYGKDAPQVRKYLADLETIMYAETTEKNIHLLQNLQIPEMTDAPKRQLIEIHKEYCLIVKNIFLAYLKGDRKSWEQQKDAPALLMEKCAAELSQGLAPFPPLWLNHWYNRIAFLPDDSRATSPDSDYFRSLV